MRDRVSFWLVKPKESNMEALTCDRAVELAYEVLDEFGEAYVYPTEHKRVEHEGSTPSCVYVHDENPSCLVGQILYRHGVSVEDLAANEFKGGWTVSERLANADFYARFFLDVAQGKQDSGMSWGEAVRLAVEHVKAQL
jgi:hypothetical protein